MAEVVRAGTHTEAVALADGTELPPTEQRVRLPECAVLETEANLIKRMVVYTDWLDTFQQLGLLPKEGEV